MSTNNVNLTSIEDILVYARKALNEMELVKFETFYRQLKQQIPGHPVIGEVKNLTSSFLQARFAEFLSGGHGQSEHLNSYMAGWIKKLDITKDIQGFSEIARRVLAQQRTLLFFDRLYTLFQVMENTSKSAGDIVELGVYRGGTQIYLRSGRPSEDFAEHLWARHLFRACRGIGGGFFAGRRAVQQYQPWGSIEISGRL